MDVNFSQIGQNVANQLQSVTPVQQEEQQEQLSTQSSKETGQENSQANSDTADNSNESGNEVDIETAVAEISDFVQAQNRQLSFTVDEDSNRAVVKVTDSESGEIIRQIPSEEVLALSERIKELQSDVGAAVGVLFNKQA